MANLKTTKTKESVSQFIATIADEQKRKDCRALIKIMHEVSGAAPAMWGTTIVGFGNFHYKYESGREGDWFLTGFSPRKQNLTLYIMSGFDFPELTEKLGKFKTGKSCLYVKRLDDLNIPVLKKLIKESIKAIGQRYGETKKAK